MFGLFNKGNFVGFWANKEGDVFLKPTMNALKLYASDVELHHYAIESSPAVFEFEGFNLKITNEDIITTVEPVAYFANGIYIKTC